ncbi:MAG: putative bifunctional diguanylate cyclase/phosphodiesterase [Caulobacterales bacterium]
MAALSATHGDDSIMTDGKRRGATDLLGLVSVGSIASFVAILCFVAASYPGARGLLSIVITGLGAGGIILFRQLRKAASSLTASEARAQYVATHDDLTQLPNKALFVERLGDAAARGGGRVCVFCVGLDRFEEVIEVLGIAASDEVIVEAAGRLSAMCPDDATVARLGDDVFALTWSDAARETAPSRAADMIRRLSEPYPAAAGHAFITSSVGVGFLNSPADHPIEALRQAQMALSSARKLGGAQHAMFQPGMDHALRNRKTLEVELRRALAEESLTMAYQPQVNTKGVIVGVEALVRWTSEHRGEIPPSTFVPLSESCGLSDAVGTFVLRRAFTDARKWPGLKVAINVSAPQIRSGGLVSTLKTLLAETGSNPRNFELEITESLLLAEELETYETLNAIRRMGFSIALDDFGTGYSSLSYLRRFPVDKIKIDRSFVSHLGKRPESSAIVKAIVDLAEALELKVLAEGVETKAQVERLAQVGCFLYQGYFYSPPVSTDAIDDMLAGRTRLAA